jgi:hypothetical protein
MRQRNRMDLWTPAELAIYNAMREVEKMPASVTLTNAVIKLNEAQSLVADFLDGEQVDSPIDKPKVVCFCGSTRFAEWFMIKRWELEKQGIITLGINILPDNYFAEGNSHGAEQEGVKHILDELHKRKIDLSDEVFILNVNGYIGESTRNELEYAKSIGKPVKYLEPLSTPKKITQ